MDFEQAVLITGVSTGIGKGIATAFINSGYRVYGSVRKQADGQSLRETLGSNFHALEFDVTNSAEIAAARVIVEQELGERPLAGLINNAGIAIGGPLMHQPVEVIKSHFDVNVFGVINVTQAFLPLLGARKNRPEKPGKIINISSVGGKIAGPFIGAYHGSKFALEGLSQTLRRELQLYGIDVVVIGPGSVNTPIWDKGVDTTSYSKTEYHAALTKFTKYFTELGKQGYSIDYLGKKVLEIFEKKNPKTRYALVPGRFQNWTIPRLLPDRVLDKIIGRSLGFERK